MQEGEAGFELDWNFQRQYELFRERSRFTGRLVALTLLLSSVLLFKVLEPFQELSTDLERKSGALVELDATRTEIAERHAFQTGLLERLTDTRRVIAERPWSDKIQQLGQDIHELNRSYQVLLNTTSESLEAAVESRTRKFGDAGRVRARTAGFRRQDPGPDPNPDYRFGTDNEAHDDATAAPTSVETPSDTRHTDDATTAPELTRLEALELYFSAMERLRELGYQAPNGVVQADGSADAPSELEHEPPPTLDEALDTMQVDPRKILAIESFRGRDEFLFRRLETRVQEEADTTIRTMTGIAETSVLRPLEAIVSDEHGKASPALSEAVSELGVALDAWRREHLGKRTWYETVQSKSKAIDDISTSLGSVLGKTSTALGFQQATTLKQRENTAERAESLRTEHERLSAETNRVTVALGTLLPGFFAGLVETSDLFQLFPMLLLLLVALVAYNAWLVREHYLWVRAGFPEGRAQGEAHSVASLWTLVRRGGVGTTVTLFSFATAITVTWLAFEHGTTLLREWSALPSTSPWAFTRWSNEAGLWFGRAVFLAAAGGTVLTLLIHDDVRSFAPPLEEAERLPRRRARAA
jgi:hypothetical protein